MSKCIKLGSQQSQYNHITHSNTLYAKANLYTVNCFTNAHLLYPLPHTARTRTLAAVARSFTRKDDTNDSASVTEESTQVAYQ